MCPRIQEAVAALTQVHRELEPINRSAAGSLLEGLDETLTIHALGLSVELARSVSPTDGIEALMSQLGAYPDTVDRWHHSDQILRWTATGLLDLEPRMHRINGYQCLKVLRYQRSESVAVRTQRQPAGGGRELVAAHGRWQEHSVEFQLKKALHQFEEEIRWMIARGYFLLRLLGIQPMNLVSGERAKPSASAMTIDLRKSN